MSEPTRADLFVWVMGENEYHEKRVTDADLAAMLPEIIEAVGFRTFVDYWESKSLADFIDGLTPHGRGEALWLLITEPCVTEEPSYHDDCEPRVLRPEVWACRREASDNCPRHELGAATAYAFPVEMLEGADV